MTFCLCFLELQDPTKQTEIDNFMVQQLDGTVNEWGWCKQKVSLHDFFSLCSMVFLCLCFVTVRSIHFMLIGIPRAGNFQLGANAILAVSLAVCKAGAAVKKIPLYKV